MSTKVPVPANPESVPFVMAPEQPHTASTVNLAHAAAGDLGYPVADFVGRCFLRLCLWADRFAPLDKRGLRSADVSRQCPR